MPRWRGRVAARSVNSDQKPETKEIRPLARSLTELTVPTVVSLVSGAAGLAALLAVEDSSEVLVGCALALAVMLVWFPAVSRLQSRRRMKAGAHAPLPAPPGAPREEPSATVRRMLSGRARLFPLMVLLLLLPGITFGPMPGKAGIVAGMAVGVMIAGGLEGARRAVRLARWQRGHRQTILLERPAHWSRATRQLYTEPSAE